MASWNTRLNIVQQFLYSGLEGSINIGDLGEMVAAMFLLFAYDEAMHECVKYLDPVAVTLGRFTKLLLGEPVKDAISESMSTDQDMGTIWNTGLVFFNHVTKLERVPNEKMLRKAFNRGCAFFLPENIPGADILIPLTVPGRETTFFAIQVKNRKEDTLSSGLNAEARVSLNDATKALGLSTPSIGMTMALRGKALKAGMSLSCSRRQSLALPPGTVHIQPLLNGPREGRKIYIYIYKIQILAVGLGESVYPVVNLCSGMHNKVTARMLAGI